MKQDAPRSHQRSFCDGAGTATMSQEMGRGFGRRLIDLPSWESDMRKAELVEAAAMLRSVLAAIEAGEIQADTPKARALVRRMEGAVIALEEAARPRGRRRA